MSDPEKRYQMVEPGLIDRLDGLSHRAFGEIDAAHLRSDMLRQRLDVEMGLVVEAMLVHDAYMGLPPAAWLRRFDLACLAQGFEG